MLEWLADEDADALVLLLVVVVSLLPFDCSEAALPLPSFCWFMSDADLVLMCVH